MGLKSRLQALKESRDQLEEKTKLFAACQGK
ncbi:unknown protein [Simkania negevensis Z]|uniref:Uncharacterized protein n=1 Tax=Simkania negevensis (strain ATCC VR-1471 / DSM 27360 / Z) TaxID=331113 RepID=F8L3J9_SIMNZ|nr:unknown protein [Simkania negevensis Z]